MNKSYRQSQILKLIRGRNLHTQDELARALRALKIPATQVTLSRDCLLYTSPSPRDRQKSRMPSSA